MKIVSVKEHSKTKNTLLFETGETLTVYKRMTPEVDEIDSARYEELFKEMLKVAKQRAMNLLIRRDHSESEIREKLKKDGNSDDIIDLTVDFLYSYHYLDDDRTAEHMVRALKNSKSLQEIKFKLKSKGISGEAADKAINAVYRKVEADETEEEDDPEALMTQEMSVIRSILISKGYTKESLSEMDYNEKQKLAAKLFRKGFKAENIRKAINLVDGE